MDINRSDPTEKKNSFPSLENEDPISFNPVDTMPCEKISGVIPGGFCPRYGPFKTGKSDCCEQLLKIQVAKITSPIKKNFLFHDVSPLF
jgi:hypothetical protein